jgi:RNA polymerase sigma-70 factor, ECF subfamily
MADAARAAHDPGQAARGPDLAALVRDHHAIAYRYAFRLCGRPAEAEDLTQQAYLIAHRKLDQLREPDRARGWLLSIVRSCFLKSVRKPAATPATDLDFPLDQAADTHPQTDPIDREELAAALDVLPDEFRLVVLMFYFEELSYQQIAEQLDVPLGTVMSRLSRAKAHLRRRLTPPDSPAAPPRPHRPVARPATPHRESLTRPR